jgi:uncharacterized protein YbcI
MSLNSPSGSGPEAGRSAFTGVDIAAADDVSGGISREIVQVYLRTFGRGPTRARTFVQPQFSVCVLRDVFTTAERALIADGDGDAVERGRKRLNAGNDDDLQAIVASRTGRTVQSHLSHVKVPANLAVHLFLFDEEQGPGLGKAAAAAEK